MRNQSNPYLQVSDISFTGNKISFNIKNLGDSNAYELGVKTHYVPAVLVGIGQNNIPDIKDDIEIIFQFEEAFKIQNKDLQTAKWHELFNDGKLKGYYPRLLFNPIIKKIVDPHCKNNEIKKNDFVTYSNRKNINFVVVPNNHLRFTCEPRFNAEYIYFDKFMSSTTYQCHILSKKTTSSRFFSIDELVSIMKHNKVDFFDLDFKLVYKNKYEDILERIFLANFVFSVKEHTNLQEAFEQGFSVGKSISYREIEQKLEGIDYNFYSEAKSHTNLKEF